MKKLTEVGTGIVTVIQMLTLLGNSNILRKTGITLAAAGAWSNLTDRYQKEKVVDYIGVKLSLIHISCSMSFSSLAVISSAASRLFDREAAVIMCALRHTLLMDF